MYLQHFYGCCVLRYNYRYLNNLNFIAKMQYNIKLFVLQLNSKSLLSYFIDFAITSIYINSTSHIICTVSGGLVNSYNWTRDGVVINCTDPKFSLTLSITNRSSVTSQVALSVHNNISHSVGTYQCNLADGNGRVAVASHIISG